MEAADEEDNLAGGDHEGTPTVTWLDALGRVYKQVVTPDGSSEYETSLELDVQGNVRTVTDPRGNDIQVQPFDLLGRACFTGAADEGYDGSSGDGETTVFFAADGQPIRTWRSGGLTLRRTFDALRRPVGVFADEGSGEKLVELRFYGDALTDALGLSQGRLVRVYDTAGEQRFDHDFRGRVTEQARTVHHDITAEADWSGLAGKTSLADIDAWLATSGGLDGEAFSVTTDYDALDRVTQQTAPDSSKTVPTYDAGGRLTAVEVLVRGASTSTGFVTEITYNARGQRESITYGNNTASTYTYDANRFWLTRLLTERSSASAHGAATLQDLAYTRDRVGNITQITDAAQETVFFSNAQVSSTRSFTYDSLYRLTQATGREKVSQTQTTAFYSGYAGSMGAVPDSGTPALRRYTQSYTYDAAGNITQTKHQQGSGGAVLWKRDYTYETANNQLLSTTQPGSSTLTDSYSYTARGAMDALPHLGALTRDFRDQLRKADLDSAGTVAWYAYDAAGQRVRKVVDKGSVVEERLYLGGYEVWRKKNGSGVVQEERQTLHVLDDQRRIAMVETLTVTGGSTVASPTPRIRYQLDDHLGTALLEVDDDGGVISYEEYHPYGTTAWWAEKSGIQVSRKRYRYTGKEKDEETGLYYHGHRYYMPWLGRWDRVDPIGLGDGGNRWGYVRNQPVHTRDPSGLGQTVGVQAQDERTSALLNKIDQVLNSEEAIAIFAAATDDAQLQSNRNAAQYSEVLLTSTMEFIRDNPDIIRFVAADSTEIPSYAAGQYVPETGEILVREGGDLSTIVHEFVHAYEAEVGPFALNADFVGGGFVPGDPLAFAAVVDKKQAHAAALGELAAYREAHPRRRRKAASLEAHARSLELSNQERAIYVVGQFATEFDAHLASRAFSLIENTVASGASTQQLQEAGERLQSKQFRLNAFRPLDASEAPLTGQMGRVQPGLRQARAA